MFVFRRGNKGLSQGGQKAVKNIDPRNMPKNARKALPGA
jgi:hypothetical protein